MNTKNKQIPQILLKEDFDVILMDYVTGALDEMHELLVASYLALCPEACKLVDDCEKLGGLLIEHFCEPALMDCESLNSVLQRLDDIDEHDPCKTLQEMSGNPFNLTLPKPVCRFLSGHEHDPRHWKTIWPGIRMLPLSAEGYACLIHMKPGARTPLHSHKGEELCLVLEGGLEDRYAHYRKGDVLYIQPRVRHAQKADRREGCVCLSVSPAPLYKKWVITLSGLLFR